MKRNTILNGFGRLGVVSAYIKSFKYDDVTIRIPDLNMWKCLVPFRERVKKSLDK